jgi:hypothetical protein
MKITINVEKVDKFVDKVKKMKFPTQESYNKCG